MFCALLWLLQVVGVAKKGSMQGRVVIGALCFAGLQGVPCRRACRALGFQARRRVWVIAMAARANFFSRNRWTCSRTTMYLRVLADFNPGEIIFDIFGEGSCLHAPSTTASAIPGASLYLACSFCSRGFEQQGNVHAATVIED